MELFDRAKYLAKTRQRVELARVAPYVPIIDLEATCTDDPALKEGFLNEIIEIGWALLRTADGVVVEAHQFYVRPTTTVVTDFCTQLTGIEPETVANAPTFSEAMVGLAEFQSHHKLGPFALWGSYGEYDRAQFERQCRRESVKNPMDALLHFNVKVAAQAEQGTKSGFGLAKAVARYGLKFAGRHHSGRDDAINIANVFNQILVRTEGKGLPRKGKE